MGLEQSSSTSPRRVELLGASHGEFNCGQIDYAIPFESLMPSLVDDIFEDPVQLKQGVCISPLDPGASTKFAMNAFGKYRVA
jgi:hypothetical protein